MFLQQQKSEYNKTAGITAHVYPETFTVNTLIQDYQYLAHPTITKHPHLYSMLSKAFMLTVNSAAPSELPSAVVTPAAPSMRFTS